MIEVAGLKLEHTVINGAGTCKTLPDVEAFAQSCVSAIVLGSFKWRKLKEPPNSHYIHPDERFSLNAKRLFSEGRKYLEKYLEQMVEICAIQSKPLILSIAGESPEEYGRLAKIGVGCGVAAIEVNLSCPTNGAAICYQREPTALTLNAVHNQVRGRIPVWVKLAYMPNPLERQTQVDLVVSKGADGLVLINTLAGGRYYRRPHRKQVMPGKEVGLGGAAILTLGLGMVAAIREEHHGVDLIGVGGIGHALDVALYEQAGADLVQATTIYWANSKDPAAYNKLIV